MSGDPDNCQESGVIVRIQVVVKRYTVSDCLETEVIVKYLGGLSADRSDCCQTTEGTVKCLR